MKFNILSKLALGALAFAFVACDEDFVKADFDAPVAESHDLPTVATGELVAATGTSAVLSASIEEVVEGNPIVKWGVLVSTQEEPTLGGSMMATAQATETDAAVSVSGLSDETEYYYRTFAYTEGGLALGEVKNFRTSARMWEVQYEEVGQSMPFADVNSIDAAFPYRAIMNATHASTQGFIACDVSPIFGTSLAALVSSPFDGPGLFATTQGNLTCYASDNLAGTYVDLEGLKFPKIQIDLMMMQYLFGMDGYEGHLEVYASDKVIETAEDFAAATLIGSTANNGQASVDYLKDYQTSAENPMQFDIPSKYWGKCYIYLRNLTAYQAQKWAPSLDLGVIVLGVSFNYYQEKAAQ